MSHRRKILTPRLARDKDQEYLKVKLTCLCNFEIYIQSKDSGKIKVSEELKKGLEREIKLNPNEKIVYKSPENVGKGLPAYLEFSVNTYRSPHYCVLGIVIASSDNKCPLLSECTFKEGSDDDCRHYFQSRSTLLGLYRVLVDFASYIEPISRVRELDTVRIRINNTTHNILALSLSKCFVVETVACIRFERRELRKTLLLFPCPSYRRKYSVKILDTPAIVLQLNDSVLFSLLENKRQDDDIKTALNWCRFKYKVVNEYGEYFEGVFIRSKRPTRWFPRNPWRRSWFYRCLDRLASKVRKGSIDLKTTIEQNNLTNVMFRKFLIFVLLNSLAHVIVGYICAKYGCVPNYFNYVIDVDEGKLYIYERATGGLGYIEAFCDEYLCEERGGLSRILTEWYRDLVCTYEESKLMKNKTTVIEVDERDLQHCSQSFRSILETIRRVTKELLSYKLHLPISTLRRVLCDHINPDNLYEVKLLDCILDAYNACFDGCRICIIQDKLGPLTAEENTFLVSKSLLKALVRYFD